MKYMTIKTLSFIFLAFLIYSCSDESKQAKVNTTDIDKLSNTTISITKGNYKVVDAKAKELTKSQNHIYLKADYLSDETNLIRRKLSESCILNPGQPNRIKKIAEDLHSKEGNIKAEFYDEYNNLSSVLYSDSAIISNRNNNMTAYGNVVIYSPTTNFMLLSDQIKWENQAKRISSLEEDVSNVTVIKIIEENKKSCVQKSEGFESDMDLSNYIFIKPKGKISEDCF
tara:strand:- start:432 stop:1112 length:681 start_codon:yes stop_codon:yes gene_type:complete